MENQKFEVGDIDDHYFNNNLTIYTSPEIYTRQTLNYSSDLYSIGLILYEMMIGRVLKLKFNYLLIAESIPRKY